MTVDELISLKSNICVCICVQDCRQRFRAVLVDATVKLDEQAKRIGRAVDDTKPYWEARKAARQVRCTHMHTHIHRGEPE